jgi:hypothetical protein
LNNLPKNVGLSNLESQKNKVEIFRTSKVKTLCGQITFWKGKLRKAVVFINCSESDRNSL